MREKRVLSNGFIEIIVWRLPEPLKGSDHNLKCFLAHVVDGRCVLQSDNEAGKGDHRQMGDEETIPAFVSIDHLRDHFLSEVARLKGD